MVAVYRVGRCCTGTASKDVCRRTHFDRLAAVLLVAQCSRPHLNYMVFIIATVIGNGQHLLEDDEILFSRSYIPASQRLDLIGGEPTPPSQRTLLLLK